MDQGVDKVALTGRTLTDLVGESEQPIVTTSLSGVSTEYNTLKEAWKQRYQQLQAALDETNRFQNELVNILGWLQGTCCYLSLTAHLDERH